MILRILLLGFIIGMVYRFLARFVLPVFQLTKTANARLREMERKMASHDQPTQPVAKSKSKIRDTDYIDYEEVK